MVRLRPASTIPGDIMLRFTTLRRSLSVRAGLLALVAVVASPAFLPAQQPQGRNLALLVGVKKYQKPLDSLEFTENDVLELGKRLEDADYKTIILCDSNGAKDKALRPTKDNIRAQLKALLKDCTKNDTVLLALAGHGVQLDEKDERRSYFCPGDAKADDKATLIALDELYKELDKSPAGVKFVLVDACRNNPAQGRGANEVVRPPKGIIAMYSCSEGQRAYETATYKHGLFFHYVLEALRTEENQNERGDVTWDRLAGYVSRHVS